jgi:HEPN domain-containing protein
MRPEALEEARDWFVRAERDAVTSAQLLSGSPPLLDGVVYHSQQSAEKALKAFLTAHDRPFPRTHDLERLHRMCLAIEPAFGRFALAVQTLNPYATQFRYPGGPIEPPIGEAQRAFQLASEILAFVSQLLFPIP